VRRWTARFDDHHATLVAQLLAHIDALDAGIAALDVRVSEAVAAWADLVERLCTIPGVDTRTGEVLIAEYGADMRVFPTSAHLASWAGTCPGNHESAGRQSSGKNRPGSKWLRTALTQAAQTAARHRHLSRLALRLIRGRRGRQKAIGAGRHDILIAFGSLRPSVSPTTTSAETGTSDATALRSRPAGWPASSSGSATRSPSSTTTPQQPADRTAPFHAPSQCGRGVNVVLPLTR
jgi:hypothetical protein